MTAPTITKIILLEFALSFTQEFSLAVLAISILTIDISEQLSDALHL